MLFTNFQESLEKILNIVTIVLQVYSSLTVTVLSYVPFALNIHIHTLSGMEHFSREVIHLCIAVC